MVKYSVFGAKGRIGSAFMKLAEANERIACYAVPRDPADHELAELGHVIFAAGVTADFRQRPYDTMNAHVALLARLLEFGKFDSLTYLSSTRVYQNANHTGTDAVFSVNPQDPSDIYTLSKLSGEALCMQAGPNVIIARLSNVIGKGEIGADTFIGAITKEARDGHIRLQSGINSSKDYIHLDDVVELLSQIPLKGKEKVYNIASGRNISNRQWIDALEQHSGCQHSVTDASQDICFPEIDIRDTVRDFNFAPKSLLEEIDNICSPEFR